MHGEVVLVTNAEICFWLDPGFGCLLKAAALTGFLVDLDCFDDTVSFEVRITVS